MEVCYNTDDSKTLILASKNEALKVELAHLLHSVSIGLVMAKT